MPDQPSLFGDEPAVHPLAGALAGIERAITDNTRATAELADAVRSLINERNIPQQPEDEEPNTEPDADPASTRPNAPTKKDDGPPQAPNRKPVQRPARWDELAGFDGAAVVGPGWVQIGARRWPFDVRSASEIIRVATTIKHTRSAPQVWVLTEVCEDLGLVAYPDDANASGSDRIRSLEHNLAELPESGAFLAPALTAGWECNGRLEPWTLLRSAEGKIVHLILEPYTWMYDHDGRGVVGDGGNDEDHYPNAITGEAEDRADEILRRVRWLSDNLGVLPDSNPVRTMQRMIDADRRTRLRAAEKGGKGRVRVATEHGRVPKMDGDAELNLDAVAPELVWPRIPSREEIDTADVAIELDQRCAYLATLSNTELCLGEPQWVEAEEAAWTISEGKPWFGVVRCESRAKWHEPRMFPPHPGMDGRRTWPQWLMAPTVDIAREDEDKGGAGWTLDDLGITGAYVWADHGRLMEPFYKDMRQALIKAEEIEDDTLRRATVAHLKGGYKALSGKWEDISILNSKHRTYRYQPLWRRQTIAATGARLFRQVRRLEQRFRGLWPVHAITDGAWYLVTREVADVLIEDGKSAKFGQLRPKHIRELTDDDRAALRGMSPDDRVISVPQVLNLGTTTKGR